MNWRKEEKPWAEAERLKVAPILRYLNWPTAKLTRELNRAQTEKAFMDIVRRAAELGRPGRFLSAGWPDYTESAHLAMREEGEAVSVEEQERITEDAHARDAERYREKREKVQKALDDLKGEVAKAGHGSRVRFVELKLRELDRKMAA